jgi:hypothetical protein
MKLDVGVLTGSKIMGHSVTEKTKAADITALNNFQKTQERRGAGAKVGRHFDDRSQWWNRS